ncbi:MAG TPA: hypothetical protein VJ754_00855 [Anaerolineae bacterium]|nr:hypothetical protein [Anaerolineae bacterium]
MTIARDTTAEHIKPLEGAIVRRYIAGAAIAAGEIVALQSDGYVDPAIGTSFAGAFVTGIALQAASAAGERIDVVTYGPVVCLTGATVGAFVYVSDTAGEPSESVGTKDVIVGFNESATVLFVRPQFIDLS